MLDIAIASSCLNFILCQHYAKCNTVVKFQYMNGLSYTHNNDLLNALLECIKFYLYIYTHCILLFYPSDNIFNFLLTVCLLLLLQELDLLEYTYIFHMHFQHQKQLLINAHMNYIACQYNYSVL